MRRINRPLSPNILALATSAALLSAAHLFSQTDAPSAKPSSVPVPVPAKTSILVGAHNCPLWEGPPNGGVWDQVKRHPERTPLLGYYDDTNPEVADWETKWAVEHGISFFVYCWYRAGKANAVETRYSGAIDALKKSRFVDQFHFSIMWENQARDPASWGQSGISGETDLLENLMPFWMANYFKHPSYLKIDNKPLLYIYDARKLAADLGGPANVAKAFDKMREFCQREGFAGLYILSELRGPDPNELRFRKEMGFDYIFEYVWPVSDTAHPVASQLSSIRQMLDLNILPKILTVSQGWSGWHDEGPNYRIPPDQYESLLRSVKGIMGTLPANELGSKMLLLDCWNEWSEGHYIAPHQEYGFGYLDAVRRVFSDAPENHHDLTPKDSQ
jgi:hypothetical protein